MVGVPPPKLTVSGTPTGEPTAPVVERLLAEAGFTVEESFYRLGLLFPAAALRRLLAGRGGGPDARSDVGPVSALQNALLSAVMRLESSLAAAGLRLPFGLSVFCVARKPRTDS